MRNDYTLRIANYQDDVLQGPYVIRYTWNKGPYVIERGAYENGVRHGLVLEYDMKGNLEASSEFDHGIISGVVTRYDRGKPMIIERYVNGVAEGLWQTFRKSGKPKTFFYCSNGVFGPVHHLDKHGDVDKIVERESRTNSSSL